MLLESRTLGEGQSSQQFVYTLTILSLAFSSVSVISTLVAFYWFVKMRRSFRHELIMLLIQSDFVKSAVFALFPILTLARGPIRSDSALCQGLGFSLAVGIEQSDIAVLLIAVHSIMYIFRPTAGLYPYRRIAYLAYYLLPIVAASVSFINDGRGYENLGHYCYLRTDKSWARVALSWGPRYVIGFSIVVIYALVYFYVRKRIRHYKRRSSAVSAMVSRPRSTSYRDVPPTPPIAYHGLIPSTPGSRRGSAAAEPLTRNRQKSISSVSTIRLDDNPSHGYGAKARSQSQPMRPFQWNWSGFRQESSSSGHTRLLADDSHDPHDPIASEDRRRPSVSFPPPAHPPGFHQGDRDEAAAEALSSPDSEWFQQRRLSSFSGLPTTARIPKGADDIDDVDPLASPKKRNYSFPNVLTRLLPKDPAASASGETTTAVGSEQGHMSPLFLSPSAIEDGTSMAQNREKIRRQLRSLFAYPLVYVATWVFPFIMNTLGYDDSLKWLAVLSIISLCIQGAVDCLLFTTREEPWRYAKASFWTSVKQRLTGWWSNDTWGSYCLWGDGGAVGRTREEMLIQSRLARQRRQVEVALEQSRKMELLDTAGGRGGVGGSGGQEQWQAQGRQISTAAKQWWDTAVNLDGSTDTDLLTGDHTEGDRGSIGDEATASAGPSNQRRRSVLSFLSRFSWAIPYDAATESQHQGASASDAPTPSTSTTLIAAAESTSEPQAERK
ncbi:G protein-coupled glucose receptor regulating Gpa2-domain-containing protein [Diplogelasinospora grovesii]|uniref:G protein-coupled glucose receptor regulating Gpa2-domain-containing protein n=1 Tax=Diplogelasinospora grovesii TaxID=303347 RepID=A0AAN6N8V4_9PEZI|nr:G protein-coupled glucose receptor regulating Gpa2-domain-containing protein [Diplogelasinospora grovesii]